MVAITDASACSFTHPQRPQSIRDRYYLQDRSARVIEHLRTRVSETVRSDNITNRWLIELSDNVMMCSVDALVYCHIYFISLPQQPKRKNRHCPNFPAKTVVSLSVKPFRARYVIALKAQLFCIANIQCLYCAEAPMSARGKPRVAGLAAG